MTGTPVIKWNVHRIGEPDKPPVLWLHGFMGSGADWFPIVEQFREQFWCVMPDLPGHGQTKVSGNWSACTMPVVARELMTLLQNFTTSPWRMVGYSMGGRLALFLVLNYPELFDRVVLESASPGLASEADRQQRRNRDELLARELETGNWEHFLDRWYRQPLFRSLRQHPEFPSLFRRRLMNRPVELARSLRSMGTGQQPSLWENLPSNKIPLLLLVGELDVKFRRIASRMVALAPGCRMKVIPGAGHNVHAEQPEQFVKAVKRFFAEAQKMN